METDDLEFRVRRLVDVQLHVMSDAEIAAATHSAFNGVATVIRLHRGFVTEIMPCWQHPFCGIVTIRHTDVPSCHCKEKH